MPPIHELTNGRYHVRITPVGGGQSCWDWIALNRWPGDAVEVVSWRLTIRGPNIIRKASTRLAAQPGMSGGARKVHLGNRGSTDVSYAVYARASLAAKQVVAGPALVEERETTTVILPGWSATVHETGCLIAERKS